MAQQKEIMFHCHCAQVQQKLQEGFQEVFRRLTSLEASLVTPQVVSLPTQSLHQVVPFGSRAVPIVNPLTFETYETNNELVPEPSPAKESPHKEESKPLQSTNVTVESVKSCQKCGNKIKKEAKRVADNSKSPQKYCSKECANAAKRERRGQTVAVSDKDPTAVKPKPVAFEKFKWTPLLERDGVEFIEGPAGTGKSEIALGICETETAVMYVTQSWIAAFEFAKKLANKGLAPFIPAYTGNVTKLAKRAADKEFPGFKNPGKNDDKTITILIASMAHTSAMESVKTEEESVNRKTKETHSVREWKCGRKSVGESIVTLGRTLKLPQIMIIDEAGTVADYILQTITAGVPRVILLGDRFQRKPIIDKDQFKIGKQWQISDEESNAFRDVPSDKVVKLVRGRRCPKDAYVLMSAFYGYNVEGETAFDKTELSKGSDVVAVPTISSMNPGEYTIDELQGRTVEGLTVFTRSVSDYDFLRMHPESVLVALSRHTQRFCWVNKDGAKRTLLEFFNRFINNKFKVPRDHPDIHLVYRPTHSRKVNSPLLSKPSETQSPLTISDGVTNEVDKKDSIKEGASDHVPKHLLAELSTEVEGSKAGQKTPSEQKEPLPESTEDRCQLPTSETSQQPDGSRLDDCRLPLNSETPEEVPREETKPSAQRTISKGPLPNCETGSNVRAQSHLLVSDQVAELMVAIETNPEFRKQAEKYFNEEELTSKQKSEIPLSDQVTISKTNLSVEQVQNTLLNPPLSNSAAKKQRKEARASSTLAQRDFRPQCTSCGKLDWEIRKEMCKSCLDGLLAEMKQIRKKVGSQMNQKELKRRNEVEDLLRKHDQDVMQLTCVNCYREEPDCICNLKKQHRNQEQLKWSKK